MQDPECQTAVPLGVTTRETNSVVDGTSIAISILIVTTIAVAFLGIVVGLVLYTYYIKKKNVKNNSYWMPHSTQEKFKL